MKTALLFDLDGTLADTEALHFEAFVETFAEHGIAVDLAAYQSRIMGFPGHQIAASFLPHFSKTDSAAIMEHKERLYRDRISHVEPPPGALDLLAFADAHRIKYALVTNAPLANAERVLAAMGVRQRFAAVISGADLPHSKPHPLPYLTALEQLGAKAERSVAFEDAGSGVRAAVAAGIPLVGVMSTLDEARLLGFGAAMAVRDFTDPRIIDLIRVQLGG